MKPLQTPGFAGARTLQSVELQLEQTILPGNCSWYANPRCQLYNVSGGNMENQLQRSYSPTSESLAVRNRVLRNTYWLLAISMIPTVLGAWVGVQFNFSFFSGSPFIGFMLFLAIAFGFFYAIERTKHSGLGVAILLGFTFFMGLMLSRLIGYTLGFSNGPSLIMTAFGGTASIFAVMATIATVSKRDFSGLGKWLFVGVLVLIVAAVANIFLQIPALYLAISVIAIAIFSAYILYDVQRIINGGETNYISATLAIYLDVYNIFTNLLALLGIAGGERD
jgi:FtsH-binding integral membrane protein